MLKVELATPATFRAWCGREMPDSYVGYIGKRDGVPVAMGGVFWDDDGFCIAAYDSRGRISAFVMHRIALRLLKVLRDIGETAVWADCDRNIPGAEKWLRRLGFTPCAGADGEEVWQHVWN
jgi:hypothetical protein